VIGEGEETFMELALKLQVIGNQADIKGIAYKKMERLLLMSQEDL
jgi:hypothetical protein